MKGISTIVIDKITDNYHKGPFKKHIMHSFLRGMGYKNKNNQKQLLL